MPNILPTLGDLAQELRDLSTRITILERQVERLGAPQYRTVAKGKAKRAKHKTVPSKNS